MKTSLEFKKKKLEEVNTIQSKISLFVNWLIKRKELAYTIFSNIGSIRSYDYKNVEKTHYSEVVALINKTMKKIKFDK